MDVEDEPGTARDRAERPAVTVTRRGSRNRAARGGRSRVRHTRTVTVGFTAILLAGLALAGCGGERPEAADDEDRAVARVQVARLAEAYYDAFRDGRIVDACGLVASRLLVERLIVGANSAGGAPLTLSVEQPDREGCPRVRQRRRGWLEPIPRSAWRVDGVRLDVSLTRARVDTTGEGSYWMRRTAEGWRIVGFGALTDAAQRELGGKWERDPAGP